MLLGGASGPPGPGKCGTGGFLSLEPAQAAAAAPRLAGVVGDENSEGKPGLGSPKRSLGDALETRLPVGG